MSAPPPMPTIGRTKEAYLRTAERPRALQPEQRHLLVLLFLLFLLLLNLETHGVLPPLPLITASLGVSVRDEVWRGEGDGELFGGRWELEEGVAEPFGLCGQCWIRQ